MTILNTPEQVSEKLSFDSSSQSNTPRYSSDEEISSWPRFNASSPYSPLQPHPFTTTHYQKILQLQLAKEKEDLRSRSNSALSACSDSTLLPSRPAKPPLSARIKHLLRRLAQQLLKLSHSKLFLPVTILYIFILYLFLSSYNPFQPAPPSSPFPLTQYSSDRGIRRIAALGDNYSFSWADWKNISDQYLPPQGPPTKFATSHGEDIPFVLPAVSAAGTAEDMRWLAHMYLAFHAAAPSKILFLDPPAQFDIPESIIDRAEIIPDLGPMLMDDSATSSHQKRAPESAPPLPQLNKSASLHSPTSANTIFQTSRKYASYLTPQFERFGGSVWPRIKSSTLVLTPRSQCRSIPPRHMVLPTPPPAPQSFSEKLSSLALKLKSRFLSYYPSSKNQKIESFSKSCMPTEDEYTRRVNNEIQLESLLPPLYPQLAPPAAQNLATLSQALANAGQKVLLTDPNTKANFYYDPQTHISSSPNQTLEQMVNGLHVATTLAVIDKTPKFFHEAVVRRGSMVYYRHMDWRFFNHEMRGDENTQAMHRLFRAWSRFAEQEGVLFWLAHGTLLGWYWNGLSMPFDIDMDLQMPVRELDRLARKYNNTLIVETPAHRNDPSGRYLLEVAPSYIERESGNRNNLIDARFIDTATGVYIDLTGVARHPSQPDGWYACKNNHFYKITDIYPLRRTLFQGAPAYVPAAYEHILEEEYEHWAEPKFEDHAFDADLQLWVPLAACRDKIADTAPDAPARSWADAEDGLERFCGDDSLRRLWQASHRLTDMHRREMALVQAMRTVPAIGDAERARLARFAVRQTGVYE